MTDPELAQDLRRLQRAGDALRTLVGEIDLGAATASDLGPAVELVETFLLGCLLPALHEVVAPYLLSRGALDVSPPRRGPGQDAELRDALAALQGDLGSTGSERAALDDARFLARSLQARACAEAAALGRSELPLDPGVLGQRLRRAYPDLDARRAAADRLLALLEQA